MACKGEPRGRAQVRVARVIVCISVLMCLFAPRGSQAGPELAAAGVAVSRASALDESAEAASTWPMFRHDRQHTGRSSYRGPASAELKWRYETGRAVRSSPAIGTNGTIYIGSDDGYLYAMNADGSLRWRYLAGDVTESSPAINTHGIIYFGANDGYLRAINPDGTLRWRHQTGGQVRSSCVIGTDGTIYVGSDDGYLYAINADGSRQWRHSTITLPPYPQLYSSPAIGADGTIYVSTGRDAYLYAINPDGSLKWGAFAASKASNSSPAIGANGAIYVGSDAGCLHAFNPDGSFVFSCGGEIPYGAYVFSSPAIGVDGTIYVGTEDWAGGFIRHDYLVAVNPSGSAEWCYQTGDAVNSSPAIDVDGTIYVGSNDGYLYAIRANGTLKWRYQTGGSVHSSPAIGADGTVYVGSDDGYLYAIGPVGACPEAPHLYTIDNPDGDGSYLVHWSAPSGSTPSTVYTLEEDENISFSHSTQAYQSIHTLTQISGKGPGTYYYRVNASDAGCMSGWSNVKSVTVWTAPTPTPTYSPLTQMLYLPVMLKASAQ